MLKKSIYFLAIILASLITGCASQNENPPPSLELPKSLNDLEPPVVAEENIPPVIEKLSANSVSGVWKTKLDEMQCQISLSRTKSGKGFRAAAMLCPVSFAHIKYWIIKDDQLLFYDTRDNMIANMRLDENGNISGETRDHESLLLWR